VAMQIVQSLPLTDAFDDDPGAGVITRLEGAPSEAARVALEAARRLACAASGLVAAEARVRSELIDRAATGWEHAWRILPAEARPPAVSLLHEDGCFGRPLGPIGGAVPALLREVAEALRPHVWEKRAYA